MILIDCLYINNGGGKILLDQLVEKICNENLNVVFLFDKRTFNDYSTIKFNNKPLFLKATFSNRLSFYLINKKKFKLIFTFGNIPPPIKLKIPTYTYLHNILYLEDNIYTTFFSKILINIKKFYIKSLLNNCNFWIVQTQFVKNKLEFKWNIGSEKILVIPFFNEKIFITNEKLNNNSHSYPKCTYLYVSNGENYKNHINLFKAFELAYRNNQNIILYITISNHYNDLLETIKQLNNKNVPIYNLGLLTKDQIHELYLKTNIVVFPSLHESFGLGLIEAAQYNIPVISSDRDYVYEIIQPSFVFNPFEINSIKEAIEYNNVINLKPAILKIENKIDQIIKILKNEQ